MIIIKALPATTHKPRRLRIQDHLHSEIVPFGDLKFQTNCILAVEAFVEKYGCVGKWYSEETEDGMVFVKPEVEIKSPVSLKNWNRV